MYLSWDFFALTLSDIITIKLKKATFELTSPIYRNKTLQAYNPKIEYTIFKPVLQQNSVAAVATPLKEHHPITLKHKFKVPIKPNN